MNESHKVLKKKLALLRKMSGYTQESFSTEIQIGYKHYQRIETGASKNPRADTLDRIADALGMETWQLLHPDIMTVESHYSYPTPYNQTLKVAEKKSPRSKNTKSNKK